MGFATDEFVTLLHRHDALDNLRKLCGERLEGLMGEFVADGADHDAGDAAHDVRTITQTANFLQDGDLLLPGNVGLEDDDHNRFRSLPKVSTKKPQVSTCGSRICSGLTQPQKPHDRPGKAEPSVDYTADLQPIVIHGAKPNKKLNAVKHRAAAGF